MKNQLFLLYAFIILGCGKNPLIKNITLHVNDVKDKSILIKTWLSVGPFKQTGNDGFDKDFLTNYGISENTISLHAFCNIKYNSNFKKDSLQNGYKYKVTESKNGIIDINKIYGHTTDNPLRAVAYLGCNLKSDKTQEVWLNLATDDGAKVWLNNELLNSRNEIRSIIHYQNYLKLTLKKGDNFLLVKILNLKKDWQVYAQLEDYSQKGMENYFYDKYYRYKFNFLYKSLLNKTDTISLFKNFVQDFKLGTYKVIVNHNSTNFITDTVRHSICWKRPTNGWDEGYYSISVVTGNDTMQQTFFVGDTAAYTKNVIEKLKQMKIDSIYSITSDADIFRLNHMKRPGNSGTDFFDNQNWQRKIIQLSQEIELFYNDVKNKKTPLKDAPGFHIKAFYSKIDNGIQHYLLNIPRNYTKDKPIPLFIAMPVDITANLPYLKSWKVANIELHDAYTDVCDKYNIAVIQPNCRTTSFPNLNSIEETDIFEALKDAQKYYNIDTCRIYIGGTCSAGYRALNLAVKYPSKFAAMGLVSPKIFNNSGHIWDRESVPVDIINNISNIPTLIIHSSLDPHFPIESTDMFMKIVKKNNLHNIEYVRLDNEIQTYYYEHYLPDLFKFFLNKTRNFNPKEVRLTFNQQKYNCAYWLNNICGTETNRKVQLSARIHNDSIDVISSNVRCFSIITDSIKSLIKHNVFVLNNNKLVFSGSISNKKAINIELEPINNILIHKNSIVEGPAQEAFYSRFIIVKGTMGNSNAIKAFNSVVDSFSSKWQERYKVNCIIKSDKDISEVDLRTANLVLIGNDRTNLIVKKIMASLPVKFVKDGIILRGKKYTKPDLGCYLTYPNPLNTKKYIVLIGANNENNISLGADDINNIDEFDISAYGFYDYRIWNNADKNKAIVESGYFTSEWK